MKFLTRIIILYFSSVIAFIVISKLFGGQIISMLKSPGLWILPFFIIAVGQIIGFLVDLGLEKPEIKKKIFNISYSIAFVGFAVTTFYLKYFSWKHERDYGYIENNQKHFEYFGGPNKAQEKIAFDSLSKILVDPNSFLLTGGTMIKIDTTLNEISDTIYLTTLRYKKRDQETTLKAKFAIWRNIAKLIYYDIPLDKEDKRRTDSISKMVIKNFNAAMRVVPDSLRNEIKNDFGDIMDK